MMRQFIGIDLGTTNSAICSYDGKNVRVWKSPDQNDVTPSAIYIDKRGNHYYGQRAYDNAPRNPNNSATLFKRFMGTSTKIEIIIAAVVVISIAANSCNSGSSSISSTTPIPTATLTPQTMPANGNVFYCSTTDRPSSFKVTNNGPSNYYMKFVEAGTNTSVITFFVCAYSTVEIDMPADNLELRYAYGTTWYGESKLFGDDTRYAKDEEYYNFSSFAWEISMYTEISTGQSMDVEYIDQSEF